MPRMMRKANHARSTSGAALLLLQGISVRHARDHADHDGTTIALKYRNGHVAL
jgi:hypothetical protein